MTPRSKPERDHQQQRIPPPVVVSREQIHALRDSIYEVASEELSSLWASSGSVCRGPSEFQVQQLAGGILLAVQQILRLKVDRTDV